MSKDIRMESFKAQDEKEVLRLLSEARLPIEDLTAEKLKNFIVARRKDGSVVGTIGLELHGDAGLLRSLAVCPAHRGKGLGKQLTHELESSARRRGLKALFLLTTTAAEFFPKLGYRSFQRDQVPAPISDTAEFKNICPALAVCLFKNLRSI